VEIKREKLEQNLSADGGRVAPPKFFSCAEPRLGTAEELDGSLMVLGESENCDFLENYY